MASSELEEKLDNMLNAISIIEEIPEWERQYKFSTERKFLFDFAWPKYKFAVEVQGGTWANGAHSRGTGLNKDFEKNFYAICNGWRVLYVSVNHIENKEAVGWIVKILKRFQRAEKKKVDTNE